MEMDKVLDHMSSYAPVVAGLILAFGAIGLIIKVLCKQDDPVELVSYVAWVGAMSIIAYVAYETQSILIALIGVAAATFAIRSFQGGRG